MQSSPALLQAWKLSDKKSCQSRRVTVHQTHCISWLLRSSSSRALTATLELPKGFKYTRTFWSRNLMHKDMSLHVQLWPGRVQSKAWTASLPLSERWCTLSLDCTTALTHHHYQSPHLAPEAVPLKEQVKLPCTSSETVTDTNGLEDSFLTISWAARQCLSGFLSKRAPG